MKKFFCSALLAVACSALVPQTVLAKILRVNTTGMAVNNTTIFATLQAAHDYAGTVNDDIIYVEPGGQPAGNLTCTKRLNIIGNGYFPSNLGLRANPGDSQVGNLSFNAGSAGSRITGCSTGSIQISASNIFVVRCYVGDRVVLSAGTNGAQLLGCYVVGSNYYDNALFFDGNPSNPVGSPIVSNCIITRNVASDRYYGPSYINGGIFENNVLTAALDVDNCTIRNNVMTSAGAAFTAGTTNAYSYNLGAGNQFGTANGNKSVVNMALVFTGASAPSPDAYYQLLPTGASNPAINAGRNGVNAVVDCGPFGGNDPYVLSGIPAVPTVYQYSQSQSGNSLNVTISTKSNK